MCGNNGVVILVRALTIATKEMGDLRDKEAQQMEDYIVITFKFQSLTIRFSGKPNLHATASLCWTSNVR